MNSYHIHYTSMSNFFLYFRFYHGVVVRTLCICLRFHILYQKKS